MRRKTGRWVSVQAKLLISYLALVVLIVLIGAVGVRNIYKVYNNGKYVFDNNLQTINYLKSVSQNIRALDKLASSVTEKDNHGGADISSEAVEELKKENHELIEKCMSSEISSDEKKKIEQCSRELNELHRRLDKVITFAGEGDDEKAHEAYNGDFALSKENTLKLIDEAVELAVNSAGKSTEENEIISRRVAIIAALAGIASIAAALGIALYMSRYITKRLESIRNLAKRLAEYDVSDDIKEVRNDEFGLTMSALNDSQFIIRDLVEKIIDESSAISDIGSDVSQAISRSGERIEAVNVQMLEYAKMDEFISDSIQIILENRSLDDDVVRRLRNILRESAKVKALQDEARGELRSINMLLEQIVITADMQNEIAQRHKEKIDKFKV